MKSLKKYIMLMAIFCMCGLLFAACSKDDDSQDKSPDNGKAEDVSLEKEALFTYEMDDREAFNITSIRTDAEGKGVLFGAEVNDDRKRDGYSYVIGHDGEAFEALELAENGDEDRSCSSMYLSPNGKYLVYDCHEDGYEFSVYDIEEEKTIDQAPEMPGTMMFDGGVKAITNDATVYLATENDDGDAQLSLYHPEDESTTDYVLDDLLGTEDTTFSAFAPTQDGDQLLITTVEPKKLYLVDLESKEAEELAEAEEKSEEYDADIFIYNAKLSSDGTYAYYKISESKKDPKYSERFFINLETDDISSFQEFDYKKVRDIDEKGNVLLEGDDELHLYNIDSEETRIIPEMEVDMSTENFTLTGNGKYLLYEDSEIKEDDTFVDYLYKMTLGDIDTYETTELMAQKGEAGSDDNAITLTEESLDEEKIVDEFWETSTDVMYPTTFPDKVVYKSTRANKHPDDRYYSQMIYMEADNLHDNAVDFTATPQDDDDYCTFESELEKAETVDGHDYYYHDFKNEDVASGVAIDGFCYEFEAQDKTKEDMLDMAQSLEPIDDVIHEISLDDVKFPTAFPFQEPNAIGPSISARDNKDVKVNVNISYRGEQEEDLFMKMEVKQSEPSGYRAGSEIDIDGWEEAYFSDNSPKLKMYDGDRYYTVDFDMSTEEKEAYGIDHIKEKAIEIGESFEK